MEERRIGAFGGRWMPIAFPAAWCSALALFVWMMSVPMVGQPLSDPPAEDSDRSPQRLARRLENLIGDSARYEAEQLLIDGYGLSSDQSKPPEGSGFQEIEELAAKARRAGVDTNRVGLDFARERMRIALHSREVGKPAEEYQKAVVARFRESAHGLRLDETTIDREIEAARR